MRSGPRPCLFALAFADAACTELIAPSFGSCAPPAFVRVEDDEGACVNGPVQSLHRREALYVEPTLYFLDDGECVVIDAPPDVILHRTTEVTAGQLVLLETVVD